MNVILFREKIFTDVMKLRTLRSFRIIKVGSKSSHQKSILIKEEEKTYKHKAEGHVKMEAEIGVLQRQAKEQQGLPPQRETRRGKALPLSLQWECGPADTLILDIWPPAL